MTDPQAVHPLVRHLRWALHRLYDPTELRRSPLVQILHLDASRGASELRRVLLEAVQSLKPPAGTSPQAKSWRIYRSLRHRYVEQFSPQEVAKTLGLSVRHARRQESLALRVLAGHLSTQYRLDPGALPDRADTEQPSSDGMGDRSIAPTHTEELEWVEKSLPVEAVAVREAIDAALQTARPLLAALHVETECDVPDGLPRLVVQRASFRQALLNTLTAAARAAPEGRVRIGVSAPCGRQVVVNVEPLGPGSSWDHAESIGMARRLIALSEGSLEVIDRQGENHPFCFRLILPAGEQAAVLVIDDNADALQLLQRYLAGTRYPFIGTRDPEHALTMAVELKPRIIVLDVMLPGIDGWELLGRLRENPLTRGIPVIVSTILPEEDLALTLGAAAFLRKPVSRAGFLAALDHQVDILSPDSAV